MQNKIELCLSDVGRDEGFIGWMSAHNMLGVSSLTFCSMALFLLYSLLNIQTFDTLPCGLPQPNVLSVFFPPLSTVCALHVQSLCFCIEPSDWPVCSSCLAERRMSRPGLTLEAAAVVVSLRALTALLQRWFCLAFCGLFRPLLFSHGEGTSVFGMKAPRHHPGISTAHGPRRYSESGCLTDNLFGEFEAQAQQLESPFSFIVEFCHVVIVCY